MELASLPVQAYGLTPGTALMSETTGLGHLAKGLFLRVGLLESFWEGSPTKEEPDGGRVGDPCSNLVQTKSKSHSLHSMEGWHQEGAPARCSVCTPKHG